MSAQRLRLFAWGLSTATSAVALLAWAASDARSAIDQRGVYEVFPLLGLVAFGLMWSHYVVAAVRLHCGIARHDLNSYVDVTGAAVLAAILLHPGLLWWQLWRDGAGLPPASVYDTYGAGGLKLAVTLGFVSLGVFLAFEFRRLFDRKTWWPIVSYGSDLAMLFIVYHGLQLGADLQDGWVRVLWYVYAATLVAALAYLRIGRPLRARIVG